MLDFSGIQDILHFMFERRNERTNLQKVKEVFWPTMGFKRLLSYLWLRLKRISVRSSIHSVAAGLSVGWAVSFNPMVGTHMLWMIPMAWMTGANYLASVIGSFIGNIWTFPFFFYVSYQVGNIVLGFFGFSGEANGTGLETFSNSGEKGVGELFLTTFIGFPIMAVMSFCVTYYPNYFLVKYLRKAYEIAKRRLKAKNDVID